MAALKNSDRCAVLKAILTAECKGPFDEIKARCRGVISSLVAQEYPEFVKMKNNPKQIPHLAYCHAGVLRARIVKEEALFSPVYGVAVVMPIVRSTYNVSHDIATPIRDDETLVPTSFRDVVIVEDAQIVQAYRDAWKRYESAFSLLSSVLNAYTTREAFERDFPEFAQHLPALAAKVSLPVVAPKVVRKKLSALGIPSPTK